MHLYFKSCEYVNDLVVIVSVSSFSLLLLRTIITYLKCSRPTEIRWTEYIWVGHHHHHPFTTFIVFSFHNLCEKRGVCRCLASFLRQHMMDSPDLILISNFTPSLQR